MFSLAALVSPKPYPRLKPITRPSASPCAALLAHWGVDYVMYSSYERNDYANREAWYAQNYPVWFQSGEYTIYQITKE